ncbi:MAG: S16 family serine protease [Candidatus Velthaea sp.]
MRRREAAFTGVLLAAALLFVAAVLPLPAYLVMPGTAVDLSSAVLVASARAAPHDRFFLTDVSLLRASPLRLAFALMPGVKVAPLDAIVPPGATQRSFTTAMERAMTQSQTVAAVLGERAAGYPVALPRAAVEIESVAPASLGRGRLLAGDVIERVGAQPIRAAGDVRSALRALAPGSVVTVRLRRAGRERLVVVRTVGLQGRTRLGVVLTARYASPRLAIPVRYATGDVGGSSGGLMMALRIYDALHGSASRAERRIAGTGTIALDGRVGPIEGTQQKLIAAKRAGARVFFVPRENYRDISAERDVRVIPVATFGEAVRALDG